MNDSRQSPAAGLDGAKDGAAADAIALVPYLKEQVQVGGRATAYVCENYTCKLPVTDPAKLAALLDAPAAKPRV